MSEEQLYTSDAIINALVYLLNSDENLSLNFMTGDVDLTMLDRPVVEILPITRDIRSGGTRGMGGQGFEHRYENSLLFGIAVFFPRIEQRRSKEISMYEDSIENLIIDHQEHALTELPDDIEWIQMQINSVDYRNSVEDDAFLIDQLTFEVIVHYAKIRHVQAVDS